MSFQHKLKLLMAEYELDIKSTEGLTGAELEEMNNNNAGMEQLYAAIEQLHQEFMAAPKKRVAAPKAAGSLAADQAAEKPKRATKAKKAEKDSEGAPAKKAPSAYSLFTSTLNKVNKGELDDLKKIKVKVSLETVSPSGKLILEHEGATDLLTMKDTEQTIETLLETCKSILTDIDGKVQPFKLSGLMWSAVGNKTPF